MKHTHHDEHSSHSHHHHDGAHSHHTHGHSHTHSKNSHVLMWPMLITLSYAFVEALSGWLTGSLALLSDAGHMFSDSAALGFAFFGAWVALKPASQRHSYGLMRAEVIVAFINGLTMLLLVAFIIFEALARFKNPQPVQGISVIVVAFFGLLVNLLVAKKLHLHQDNLNNRAAFIHVMGDALGSVAAILAGAIIYFTNWLWVDPLLSLLIAGLILVSTINLLREALHVLMEGVPKHIDLTKISEAMAGVEHVHEVHGIHVWSLSSEKVALSAHVVLDDITKWHEVLDGLNHLLADKFSISHITLQPETIAALNAGEVACWLTHRSQAH